MIQVSIYFFFPACSLFFDSYCLLRPNFVEPGSTAGYTATGAVTGISHLHVSGTGGGNSYQVISILPIGLRKIPDPGSGFISERGRERGSVGYFGVQLDDFNVDVEMSATRRGAIHRYTWLPDASQDVHIVFDVGYMPSHMYSGGSVDILRRENRTIVTGKGTYRDIWSGAYGASQDEYDVFFCAESDGDIVRWGVWNDDGFKPNVRSLKYEQRYLNRAWLVVFCYPFFYRAQTINYY